MRRVQGLHDAHGVRRAVEEIGIAEGDVPRAGGDLRGDVGQHDVGLHDAELPLVDRHDRTMPAQVPAAAAGLGVADRSARCRPASAASRTATAAAAPIDREPETRGEVRHAVCTLIVPSPRRGLRPADAAIPASRVRRRCTARSPPGPPRTRRQAPRRRRGTCSHAVVERRVEPVRADARRAVQAPRLRDQRTRPAASRCASAGGTPMRCGAGQRAVGHASFAASTQSTSSPRAQPCGRRRQTERLASQFVGGDQQCARMPARSF